MSIEADANCSTTFSTLQGADVRQHAIALFSQQVWCWGQDILRPDGNWLLEMGFERLAPPEDQETSSVYTLKLPEARCVVLRGFGMFFGDANCGGIFLYRYQFQPQYTSQATLRRPPWSATDLPKLKSPTDSQMVSCTSLTLRAIDWMREYEAAVAEKLGIDYRRETLQKWDDGKRQVIPAKDIVNEWTVLSAAVAQDFQALVPKRRGGKRN